MTSEMTTVGTSHPTNGVIYLSFIYCYLGCYMKLEIKMCGLIRTAQLNLECLVNRMICEAFFCLGMYDWAFDVK